MADATQTTVQVPLSEDLGKWRPEWTAADCLNELKRIANIDTEKVVTRNYFRNHFRCSEATWNRYFGTFHEFKRQAGIVLSRHAHSLEKQIAKHASKDVQRATMAEKLSYAGAYLRPSSKRFQTVLTGSDMHGTHCDPFYRRLFIETARRTQPEKIVLNGDVFDLAEFSKYSVDPRRFQILEDMRWVHAFIEDLRNACPDSEIIFIEGNHEFRLLRHLSEQTPALQIVLSDLLGMTVADLLGISKYEINLVARADLGAFSERDTKAELKKNYAILYDALVVHHHPEGRNLGYPGISGHYHKHEMWTGYSPIFGPFEWHQLGCGHVRNASYCAGEKWSNGFMLTHVDTQTKHSAFEYIDVRDFAIIGGEFYTRLPSEGIYPKR